MGFAPAYFLRGPLWCGFGLMPGCMWSTWGRIGVCVDRAPAFWIWHGLRKFFGRDMGRYNVLLFGPASPWAPDFYFWAALPEGSLPPCGRYRVHVGTDRSNVGMYRFPFGSYIIQFGIGRIHARMYRSPFRNFRFEFDNYGIKFGTRKARPGGLATHWIAFCGGAVSRSETAGFDAGVPFLAAKRAVSMRASACRSWQH